MGEQLKIDDPETIPLATKLAESRSVSITELLREMLEREDCEQEAAVQERIRRITLQPMLYANICLLSGKARPPKRSWMKFTRTACRNEISITDLIAAA